MKILSKIKLWLDVQTAMLNAATDERRRWLKRQKLLILLEEELQYQRDLQCRLDSLGEHMVDIIDRIASLKHELGEMNSGKIDTPSIKENDHATRPRDVDEDAAKEHQDRGTPRQAHQAGRRNSVCNEATLDEEDHVP